MTDTLAGSVGCMPGPEQTRNEGGPGHGTWGGCRQGEPSWSDAAARAVGSICEPRTVARHVPRGRAHLRGDQPWKLASTDGCLAERGLPRTGRLWYPLRKACALENSRFGGLIPPSARSAINGENCQPSPMQPDPTGSKPSNSTASRCGVSSVERTSACVSSDGQRFARESGQASQEEWLAQHTHNPLHVSRAALHLRQKAVSHVLPIARRLAARHLPPATCHGADRGRHARP